MTISVMTLNIGAASRERAERILSWLASRKEDIFVLTETSAGPGTSYLIERFRQSGYSVVVPHHENGERGAAIVGRLRLVDESNSYFYDVSLPSRIVCARLSDDPRIVVVGVYVPSRDQSPSKTFRKQRFVESFQTALARIPPSELEMCIMAGDYNAVSRTHEPSYSSFKSFEYNLFDNLTSIGLVDAFDVCSPGEQAHSWIGRTGDGYRYDYIHVGSRLKESVAECRYLQETRESRLTDHAAVIADFGVSIAVRLETRSPLEPTSLSLF